MDEESYSENNGTVSLNTSEGWEIAFSKVMNLYLEGQVVQIDPIRIVEKSAFIMIRKDDVLSIYSN